jgi:hypothetical protein
LYWWSLIKNEKSNKNENKCEMIKAGGEYEKCLFIKFMKKTIHGKQQL